MKDGLVEAFVDEVIRLLTEEFPPEGLIIDVRGNGGGYIIAAEFLLQLLTSRRIEPEPVQFINTPVTLDLTAKVDSMRDWHDSLLQGVRTGAQYSRGIPLSSLRSSTPLAKFTMGQWCSSPTPSVTALAICLPQDSRTTRSERF